MLNTRRMRVSFTSSFALVLALAVVPPAHAQVRSSARIGVNKLGAPIPDPIFNAKRVFISFELGDVADFQDMYSGGPERAYSEFYSQMKAWGHYQLVTDPKDAEMIFAIRFTGPIRLTIYDATGRVSLWGFVEQVDGALFKKHRDNQFSTSVGRLMVDLKALVGEVSPTGGPPQP